MLKCPMRELIEQMRLDSECGQNISNTNRWQNIFKFKLLICIYIVIIFIIVALF